MVGSTGVISDWSIEKNPAPAASTVKVSRREPRREGSAMRENSLIGTEGGLSPVVRGGRAVGIRVGRPRGSCRSRGKLTGGKAPDIPEGCLH
ncbi:hypothetical protein GCM10027614_25080 [Micromonospora vulcania]